MLGKSEQNPNEPLFTFDEVLAQEEAYTLDHFTQKDVRRMAEIMFGVCDEYQMSFAFEKEDQHGADNEYEHYETLGTCGDAR